MRVLVQRVHQASCKVDHQVVGKINKGFVLFVGFKQEDTLENGVKMANKIINARLFEDENGKLNLSVVDVQGQLLSISQFTLYADTKKGHRPSFDQAARPEKAKELFEAFNQELRKTLTIETGIFQAHMDIDVLNDGPVSVLYEN
jgi:D-aminoacyl-tRNA deacylase